MTLVLDSSSSSEKNSSASLKALHKLLRTLRSTIYLLRSQRMHPLNVSSYVPSDGAVVVVMMILGRVMVLSGMA